MSRLGLLALIVCSPGIGIAAAPHVTSHARSNLPGMPGAPTADELTALPAAALPAGQVLRAVRDVAYGARATPAWTAFARAAGGAWQVSWDRATGVPTRIWGSGILAPGASASPELAELYARAWLGNHLALLAPGASASDFVLVSNSSDGDIRSVGFFQYAGGLRVVGGQIGFEFKRDRLFVIGSTALPDVAAPPRTHLARAALAPRAEAAVRAALALPAAARASALGDDVIVPLVGETAVLGYRVTSTLTVDAGATGKYLAYVDPATGEPIAVRQQNMYDTGALLYRGVDRYPGRGRIDQPAPRAHVTVNGAAMTSGPDGSLPAPSTVATSVAGDLVTVVDQSTSGVEKSVSLALPAGSSVTWDESSVEAADAEVVTYLAINTVKAFVRANVDADLPTLEDPLTAHVNIDDVCNAYFDGTSVNFFHSGSEDAMTHCENTGRINDVMFHEFGHDVHVHEIIPGVGSFDGAMSEGAADTLAVNITGDSGLGRGFFYSDTPLRELNPMGTEATWPRDIGEIHTTGLIFGGTWWDLRAAAHAALGDTAGEALTLRLYVGALRRSVDIPSSLVETLAADDDDGDLSNGTPHECLIRDAYGAHGMYTATATSDGPSLLTGPYSIGSRQIRIHVDGISGRCASDAVVGVQVDYAANGTHGTLDATQFGPTDYYAQLPLPTHGTGSYDVQVHMAAGGGISLPDNRADPAYHVYQGDTVELYCTDFETDPFADGWTQHAKAGNGDWAWSVPAGSGTDDPPAAYAGTHALVESPGSDSNSNTDSTLAMPAIDVRPYSDVRLQYRRWLGAKDHANDQATITANGDPVWQNATDGSTALDFTDKEWRFHDVPLSGQFVGSAVQVAWSLHTDGGRQLAGWALDDVCLVANPDAICGDGIKQDFVEQCDDGSANADAPDKCRTDCDVPRCGDSITDSDEECDRGSGDATCTAECKLVEPSEVSGGCDAGGGLGGGGLVPGVGVALAAVVRRRRRRVA